MIPAVSNIAWQEVSDSAAASALTAAGIGAMEVAPGRIFSDLASTTPEMATALAAEWRERGLRIVSMQALLFGQPELRLFGDTADQSELLDHLDHVVALAGALGCGPLVFGSPKNRLKGERSFGQAVKDSADILRRIGDLCAQSDTTFCFEANAKDYGCDFATNLTEAAEVVQAVDHPNVRMIVDTGNMILAEDDPETVSDLASLVAHFHISAPMLVPVQPHEAYISAVLGNLSAAGYDDVVTLEMRPAADGPDALTHAVAGAEWLCAQVAVRGAAG